jgi:tetratricopeptide (TPR) repeat protein
MADNDPQPAPAPTPLQQQSAREQFALAQRLLGNGNCADAIQLMRDCCKLDPGNLNFRRALRDAERKAVKINPGWLGNATLKTKLKMAKLSHSYFTVLEYGEALLARDPADIGCQLDMAEAAAALGVPIVALWILEHARRQDADNDAVNLALALVYEQVGELAKAIGFLQKVAPTNRDHADIERRIKDLMAKDSIRRAFDDKTGAPPEALIDTAQMPTAEPTGPNKAVAPALPDRVARDVEALRTRIAADATNVNGYLSLSALLRNAGQLEQARDVLREGQKATANHVELTLALVDLKIEHKRRALADLERQMRANPQDASLKGTRMTLLQVINQGELQLYRQKVEYQPTDMGPRFELAVRMYRAGNFQEAVHELQITRGAPRYQWQSLAYLGLCFEKLEVWKLAQRNLKDALDKLPADEKDWRKRILFHLANGAAAQGDLDEAIAMGYELANLDFTFRGIDRLIAGWRQRLTERPTPDSSMDSQTPPADLESED